MELLPSETRALDELTDWIRNRFGARVCELSLFGSKARAEAHEESDIDVLIVVDGLTPAERREIWHFCGDLLTRHDVIVGAFAVSKEHMATLRARERAIASEIARDAIPLRLQER